MKKPGGTEKKRVKQSSGSSSSTARFWFRSSTEGLLLSSIILANIFQTKHCLFAEKVRDNKGLESRWAVMEEARDEYFRGKYFVSFLKNHPECKEILEEDKDLDAEDIANVLLEKNVLVHCDRLTKTVHLWKKKLSTWPAHLEIYRENQGIHYGKRFCPSG
ncbi:unnamed protein product [Eruca vesicaria subsp. sativa]|uniref:Uncharacterized protein n=1 Tax=Eruca vesicaria subsp. sativa TaxID=29727 RepID=A0ABC8JSR6_ERUVS|nr:unnamed protein product [Eruca vesicaria subsp. sativa]